MLDELKKQTQRPAVVLMGDMRELGPAEAEEHLQVAHKIAEVADMVYLVGTLTETYVKPQLEKLKPQLPISHFTTSKQAAEALKTSLPQQALLLCKGSQNTIFLEEAVKDLLTDSGDASRLCRQEPYWLARKEAFFAKHIRPDKTKSD